MFSFLVKYAVRMFFLAFVICMNVQFFFLRPIGPFVLYSMRPKEKRVRRQDAMTPSGYISVGK